jgi:DNA-binding CsgD family transcriptional regulator
MDRYDLSGSTPRYAWPVVAAGGSAVLAAAWRAGVAHEEQLRDEATALADRLRRVAEKLGTFGPAQRAWQLTFTAADAHAASLLATSAAGEAIAAGEAADAGQAAAGQAVALTAAWDEAAAAWLGLGEPYPQAHALLYAAEAALARGDRDGAAARLRRAAPLAAGLGARPLGEQIAILSRRARIRLDDREAAGQAAGDGELGLTERELEVLRLVAAGRSNRDIAAELFISPKTASVHVSNILGKLGVGSRGEAAARAHALRLFGPG